MKAIIDMPRVQHRSSKVVQLPHLQPESYAIKKLSHQEIQMQQLYFKLQQLVPSCSVKQKMSKKDLLQNVIDYIFDLEDTLDLEPSSKAANPLTECSNDSNKMDTVDKVNIQSLISCCYMVLNTVL